MDCDHASFCGGRGWKVRATDAVIAPDADALGPRESHHTPARSGMLLSTFVASKHSAALPLIHADLLDAGIALHVEDPLILEDVVIEFLRAADVHDRVGVAVESDHFFRHPRRRVPRKIAVAEAPAILEAMLLREFAQRLPRIREVRAPLDRHRVVARILRVLDVVHLVPEPLEADDVMNVLPHHARERHLPHGIHRHDLLLFHVRKITQEPASRTARDCPRRWCPQARLSSPPRPRRRPHCRRSSRP